MRSKNLLVGLAALAVILPAAWVLARAGESSEAEAGPPERSFVFDASPETVVLRVRRSPRGPTYELRGDGALSTNWPGRRSAQYSTAELHALLERLSTAGVFDLDQDELSAAIAERPRAFVGSTPYSARIDVNLVEYRGPDQNGGTLALRLAISQPDQVAAHFPERADLRAIVDLLHELAAATKVPK